MIDLDRDRLARAARREGGGQAIDVQLGGQRFQLPAELPAAVLDIVLDGDLDLAALVRSAAGVWVDGGADPARQEEAGALVIEALMGQPTLPVDVARTIRAAVAALFGEAQWARFVALGPSLADVAALIKGLVSEYGVSLGEAFKSPKPSAAGGATSRPTSNGSTTSTPAAFGPALATPGS